jgi:AraC-like DNA-binding protein
MALEATTRLRVVRHSSHQDRWEMVFGAPHPRLRPYVIHYCGYDEETTSFTRRIEAAGLRAPLIFNFGPPVAVRTSATEGEWERHVDGFVAGLDGSYALVESTGSQSGVEVYLTPVGAGLMTGVPMRHLRGRVVALDDLFGRLSGLLREELVEAPGWAERFAIVDRFLLARLSKAEVPPASLAWALSRLQATRGAVEIGSLTAELGCSRRYLIGVFNDHVGLPPKLFSRILRFEHALELADGGGIGWAEIAQRCGYYDQAHMIGDFQQFTGHSPTAYAALKLPDDGGVAGD